MIYEIIEVDNKGPDWKVATVREMVEGGQTHDNISINRKNRDETIAFAQFDLMMPGFSFEGSDIWRNAKGTGYIFAPKPKEQPKKPWGGAGKTAAVEKAMDRKEAAIEHAQERKEDAIKLAGAMRDATLVSLAALRDTPFPTDEEYKAEWTKWVKWFLNQGDQPFIS